jgi:hypothetical protein
VPGEILYEADRLESLFFAGYDPHFEGDEPQRVQQKGRESLRDRCDSLSIL